MADELTEFLLVTNHAKESAEAVGIIMPPDILDSLIRIRAHKYIDTAIKVKQGNEDRWIVPFTAPMSIYCDKINCWLVLSEPNEEDARYRYILKTILHENSPIVRAYWHSEEPGSPVESYLKWHKTMKELGR